MEMTVSERLKDFVLTSFLFGDESRMPTEDESLLQSGILDSTGVLELIEFIEESFGIQVSESETVPENLGSLNALTRYINSKSTQHTSTGAL